MQIMWHQKLYKTDLSIILSAQVRHDYRINIELS